MFSLGYRYPSFYILARSALLQFFLENLDFKYIKINTLHLLFLLFMASKVPIKLKDYKVRKKPKNGVPQAGYDTIQCIVNVSPDLADYLGLEAYTFPPSEGENIPNPVNVTKYGSYSTGTYHGRTCIIITDGQGGVPGSVGYYKKTYHLQIPANYPITFLKDFLYSRQLATSNTMKYVKVANGRRFPIPSVAPATP